MSGVSHTHGTVTNPSRMCDFVHEAVRADERRRTVASWDWAIHAFALMTNHYHLVVRVGACGLARGVCRLNSGYATWFDAQQERVNHLFGRRYWNDRLEDERHYFAAVRYVVRNPLRAGIPVPGSKP
jgi:REP element-mobilizing transposase RayT